MTKYQAKKVAFKDNEGNYIVPVIDPADKGSLSMVDKTSGVDTTGTLTSVKIHSKTSWVNDGSVGSSEMAFIPFTGVYEDYYNPQTVTANTDTVFTKDGVFRVSSSAISTITMILQQSSITIYDTSIVVKAGQHFKSTLAGKFFFYEGQ